MSNEGLFVSAIRKLNQQVEEALFACYCPYSNLDSHSTIVFPWQYIHSYKIHELNKTNPFQTTLHSIRYQ